MEEGMFQYIDDDSGNNNNDNNLWLMNTNFVRQKVDSLNVQVKEFRFNILALKIRFRSKLLQKFPAKNLRKREIISEAWTGEIELIH